MTTIRTYLSAIIMVILMCPAIGQAQFHTIKKKEKVEFEKIETVKEIVDSVVNQDIAATDTISLQQDTIQSKPLLKKLRNLAYCAVRKKHPEYNKKYKGMPGLTISNLLAEIRKNNIQHEKIVLAQAILETGWFTSTVCLKKNNLFGLTNPRTGQYYEFDHWTESVKAYYDKVQYRYKGGNYLEWLDEIGYAEADTYVKSLIEILRQYLM